MRRDLKPLGLLMAMLLMAMTILLLFGSCVTQNKCLKKFPPQSDSVEKINTVETVIYKDTTIIRTTPADTVKVEKLIPVPVDDIEAVKVENDFAIAQSWVYDNKIHLHLLTKPKAFEFKVQNKVETRYVDRVKTQHTTVRERYIPKWLFWLVSILLINLAFTVYRLKRTGRFF